MKVLHSPHVYITCTAEWGGEGVLSVPSLNTTKRDGHQFRNQKKAAFQLPNVIEHSLKNFPMFYFSVCVPLNADRL